MDPRIHPVRLRQLFLISIIILLGVLLFRELHFMLNALLGAVTLYILMREPMHYLVNKHKWNKVLAAIALMMASVLIFIVPVVWLSTLAYEMVWPIVQQPTRITQSFTEIQQYLIREYDMDVLTADNIASLNGYLVNMAQTTLQGTLSALGTVLLMYFILYFLLVQGLDAENNVNEYLPLKMRNAKRLLLEFRNQVYSNAIGIPLVAMLQGLVALIGYWIFGVQSFILFGILTAIVSVMPVVGSMVVWLPLMIYELSQGHQTAGIGIGLWGLILVGSVDNIARFLIQKKIANVHPLITIFGVLIGVNLFGFIGIVFGPILISMFILLLRVYMDEFGRPFDQVENTPAT
jgi:predicted PurR-regulated permease PerM